MLMMRRPRSMPMMCVVIALFLLGFVMQATAEVSAFERSSEGDALGIFAGEDADDAQYKLVSRALRGPPRVRTGSFENALLAKADRLGCDRCDGVACAFTARRLKACKGEKTKKKKVDDDEDEEEENEGNHAAGGAAVAATGGNDGRDDEDEISAKADKMMALLKQADEMQQMLRQLEAGIGTDSLDLQSLGAMLGGEVAANETESRPADDDEEDEEPVDGERAQAVLDRLQKLEAEKSRFESMLKESQQEHDTMLTRLNDMRSLMSALGMQPDAMDGDSGASSSPERA
eukprot:gnl/TRDRNA2_/TRDRNA2_153197_c0_seq1.p1 gnl/TRDRNA2_/TRDRNA2_153197_c0~~gnl/TRDRNA2_/TRDRNA2_153197_c0_seq1.p1  ORF type:complete len:289 (-),score=86.29 gnl/TRDRNA2_/TRDRNA2_153197_c0_seq1:108-974(-)